MTETPEMNSNTTLAVSRGKIAKRQAWNCFFEQGNCLTLIAAILVPLVLYMALQGVYAMLYFAYDGGMGEREWFSAVHTAVNVLILILDLPLVCGTLYITTGIARGERRELRDVFYAYTSWRAYLRAWVSILLPVLAFTVVFVTVMLIRNGFYSLSEMAFATEEGAEYAGQILKCGDLLATIAAVVGLLWCSYVLPLIWLMHETPELFLLPALCRSVAVIRGHLLEWTLLCMSFFGWLLLSVVTVGILLVLFTIPYFLLTVTYYIDAMSVECISNGN